MIHIHRKKSSDAFLDVLYRDYRKLMLSIARIYVGDTHLSEDVVHDAFISLIRNEDRIKTLSTPQLRAYIVLTVRHASIDYLRKERKMNLADMSDDVLLDLISKSGEVKSLSMAPFQTVEFRAVMQQLSEEDQILLVGRHFIGLNSEELAGILGCTSGAVRVKLHRAGKRALELFKSQGLSMEDFLL